MGATTAAADTALIQSDAFVNVMGGILSLDGLIHNSGPTGRILIDATDSATFYGAVRATSSLTVHAGVSADWTDAELYGSVTIADLHGGNVTINGGRLSSGGTAEIVAGGNVEVIAVVTAAEKAAAKKGKARLARIAVKDEKNAKKKAQ